MNKNADQDEIECGNRLLLAECELHETRLRAAGKAIPARPAAASGQDIVAANNALSAHVTQLKTLAGTPCASMQKPATASTEKKSTLTDKVIAAKGVKTLDALPQYRDPLD